MTKPECSCASFKRLEGASVPAYTKAFLEQMNEDKHSFRCRACGRVWERRAPEHEGGRAALVRREEGRER